MPRIDIKIVEEPLKKIMTFYNIKKMKNILKSMVLILTLVLFNKSAFSCDALKNVKLGEDFSKSSEILDFIDTHLAENYDEGTTAVYEASTADYCPDMGLENTTLKVFIYDSKIAGMRLETWDLALQKNEIYNFVKNYYGNIGEKAKEKNWTGFENLSSGGYKLYYAKMLDNDGIIGGVVETFDISTEELMNYTISEDIVEVGE